MIRRCRVLTFLIADPRYSLQAAEHVAAEQAPGARWESSDLFDTPKHRVNG